VSTLDGVARAYDALAPDYDRQVAGDAWVRQMLWDYYASAFRVGQHVLDVGCGTGIDALYLARRGIHVIGIDASPGMVARFREKFDAAGLAHLAEARVLDLAALESWPARSFDGIISAFAGLNTVPSLGPFAADAARLVRPEGRLIVHMLNRWSLWEFLGLLGRGDWRGAAALGQKRQRAFVIGGQTVQHYPSTPEEATRAFEAAGFCLRRAAGLGILRPPHTVRRIPPAVVDALDRAESKLCGHPWFVRRGRQFVLDLERLGK
jgi:SAM-dependent methyltransferase